jgi:hypothetical protein
VWEFKEFFKWFIRKAFIKFESLLFFYKDRKVELKIMQSDWNHLKKKAQWKLQYVSIYLIKILHNESLIDWLHQKLFILIVIV